MNSSFMDKRWFYFIIFSLLALFIRFFVENSDFSQTYKIIAYAIPLAISGIILLLIFYDVIFKTKQKQSLSHKDLMKHLYKLYIDRIATTTFIGGVGAIGVSVVFSALIISISIIRGKLIEGESLMILYGLIILLLLGIIALVSNKGLKKRKKWSRITTSFLLLLIALIMIMPIWKGGISGAIFGIIIIVGMLFNIYYLLFKKEVVKQFS